jgi:DNA helicase-2/ATP-dependent DNA helicase PcrA
MRLLTGPQVQLGPRDLVALGSWSRELHRRRTQRPDRRADAAGTPAPGAHPQAVVIADVVDESSLVEALDDLPGPDWADADGRSLSPVARQRLQQLAGTVRGLRGRTSLSLPELVVETERALLLDVEVASRPGVRPAVARAHLDALAQVAGDFAATADHPTLGAFLAWLDAAAERERGLEPGEVEVDPDAVQLMTVHAAKGLEWDVVAVPGMVEGTFPAHSTRARHDGQHWRLGAVNDSGWLTGYGSLPHALRGDADGLPDVRWSAITEQTDVEKEIEAFKALGGAHELAEERRLAYVALTRARRRLLLTTHVWSDGSTPRLPSRFVHELLDGPAVDGLSRAPVRDLPPEGTENPRTATPRSVGWPTDPLGARRADVEAGAARVAAALARQLAPDGSDPAHPGAAPPSQARPVASQASRAQRWEWEADVLLAERDRGRDQHVTASLPSHLSASRLVQLAADPVALALDVRRPMPREPVPGVRRGTAFHAWVERRLGVTAMVDVTDLPGAADDGAVQDADLAALQRNWLDSEWASREVVAVEAAIETPVDGTVVRGRVDAVMARADGGVDVVDWKTGRPPTGRDAEARAVQLAAYRLAWSRLHGLPLERVGAAFFYAATGETVRPVDLLDEAGLVRLLRAVDTVDPARG